nr:hypothetical protein [Tanacetum cinerariifolium]
MLCEWRICKKDSTADPYHDYRRAHYDVLLNNMCEKVISKSDGPLTPNATRLFKTVVKDAGQLKIGWNGGDLYQANCP